MNMKVKKLLSGILAAAMAVTSLTGALTITASAATEDEYFTYSYNPYIFTPGEYMATLKTGADFSKLSNGELILPDTFDDGANGKANVNIDDLSANSSGNNTIKSIKTNSSLFGGTRAFRYLNALEKIEYTNKGELKAGSYTFRDCSNTLKDIYIYASRVTFDGGMTGAGTFRTFVENEGTKIHVMSETVKQQIIDGTASGSYPVTADKIEVMESSLPTAVVTLTCEDITYGTEGGFKPSATVKVNDSPVEDAKVTIKMFTDVDCVTEYGGRGGYTANDIAAGTYYFRAFVDATDTYMGAMSDPLEVHVNRVADIKKLQEAIEKAGTYTTQTDVYSTGSLRNLTQAVDAGKALTANSVDAWTATQETVDAATEAIENAITGLVNKADMVTQETWLKLNNAHNKAINTTDTEYTPESYEVFKQARDAFEEIYNKGQDALTEAEAVKAIADIEAAFEKLVEKTEFDFSALEEAVKKAKPIVEDPQASETYTSSTLNALKEAYETATSILADRESVKYQATIINAAGNITTCIERLVKVDKEALYNELQQAISDAEARDADIYTADTYKTFKDALDAARKITMSSTVEQIETATANLKAAVEGLKVDQDIIPAGGPLGYIYHTWTETPFYSGTTDDAMVGATQIRLTFDCADDTSFNRYFNVNYTVNVGTTKSDTEVRGTATEENLGEKGCTAILNLNSPIEAGEKYNIIGYTFGYNTSKDYVFAITKIEFLDANGKILKTITDVTAAKEQLDAAIAKAGAVDAAAYTAESYAELTKAVDAAKALTDKATVAEITAAKDAIEAAIKALVPIEVPVLGAIEGTIKTPGADAEVTVTVATADGETVAEATAANGEYSISDLEDGEYIVTFAADGYAARSYTAAVAGGSVTLEAEIHLYGDVNGDGEITTADVGMANSHAREVSALEGYDFDVAEVTGDGEVTTADVGVINATAQKI